MEMQPARSVIETVSWRAIQRSANFIERHGMGALLFGRKPKLWDYVSSKIPADGLMIECGVFEGRSINAMAANVPDRTVYGFDSFEGLEEDWVGSNHLAGHFDLKGRLPEVAANVVLTKGWVQDTLPPFLVAQSGPIAYLHIDTDTYAPAQAILRLTRDRLVPGSIILFDELIGYPFWEEGEYKALVEELDGVRYSFIAFSNMQAAIQIKDTA